MHMERLTDTTLPATTRHGIQIPVRDGALVGDLDIPAGARGIVIFARGSGNARHNQRNDHAAMAFREAGFATLLPDLLTEAEEREDELTAELRFDISFLTSRLTDTIAWVAQLPETRGLPIGLFGTNMGAAVAIAAAAADPQRVRAVVCSGGHPDPAKRDFALVSTPTMLIVGGYEAKVLGQNSEAFVRLRCEKRFCLVPGSTHLSNGDTLDAVARGASEWFTRHLSREAAVDDRLVTA